MKLFYSLFLFSFCLLSVSVNAQNFSNNHSHYYLLTQDISTFNAKAEVQNNISFLEVERIANKLYLDSLNRKKYNKTSINRVPSVVYGLGGLVLYFAGQKLLYGSLDNANLLAPILTTISGVIIGEIINSSSRNKPKTTRR